MINRLLFALLSATFLLSVSSSTALGQTNTASTPAESTTAEEHDPIPQDDLTSHLAEAESQAKEIVRLLSELDTAEGEEKTLILDQVVRNKKEYRELLGKLVEDLADTGTGGVERKKAEKLVEDEGKILRQDIEAVQDELKSIRTKREQAETEGKPALTQRISELAPVLDHLLSELYLHTERMKSLGIEATADSNYLDQTLTKRADSLVSRIDLVINSIDTQSGFLSSATEDDQKVIEGKIKTLEEKKTLNSSSLRATVDVMNKQGLDTTEYSQLLIKTTGEITGDILDKDVAVGLAQQWLEQLGDWVLEKGPMLLVKLIVVLLILLIFKLLSRMIGRVVRKGVSTSKLNLSQLLQEFFVNIAIKAVMVVGILVALSQLGVQIGPLLAGLGVVGFIVGFALQDTLSNFASGMMILVYRPFDVGNVIEAGGVFGKVQQMSLVSTTIMTPDNQKLVVPNNKIWGGVIRNVTAPASRRVDMTFGIGYGDDIAHAERVLSDIIENHPLVLKDPEPVIKVHTLGESSVDFVVRPWVRTADYWDVYWDITRTVKERFDSEAISIPFPQRDVHLYQENPAASS